MKIDLKFAELHAPLFLAGKNFGLKLEPGSHKHTGMVLVYDRAEKELLVTWMGEEAIVPVSNVATMTVKERTAIRSEPLADMARQPHSANALSKATAQVHTPQSHVHAGPGHGDTGQEKRGKVVL